MIFWTNIKVTMIPIFGIKMNLLGGMRRVNMGNGLSCVRFVFSFVFVIASHNHVNPKDAIWSRNIPFDGHCFIRIHRRSFSFAHNDQHLNTTTNPNTMHWHRNSTCFTAETAQQWQRCMCMRLVLRECEHSTVIVYAKHVAMRAVRWVAQVLARGVQWEHSIRFCISGGAESKGPMHVHFVILHVRLVRIIWSSNSKDV